MTTHPYWGELAEDWAGMAAEHPVFLPGFTRPIPVFLGEELVEEGAEYALTAGQLDDYAATFQSFLAAAPRLLADFRHRAFARYQQHYARYYDTPAESGAPPLGLRTAEQHAAYLQNVGWLRITDGQTLRLAIHYDLDTEHGLEAKFVGSTLVQLGGIADT